jgi:hypothetical protein
LGKASKDTRDAIKANKSVIMHRPGHIEKAMQKHRNFNRAYKNLKNMIKVVVPGALGTTVGSEALNNNRVENGS